MKLTIETMWNKIVRDETQPFGSRVLPEYERKDIVVYQESGWTTRKEWEHSIKQQRSFKGFDEHGRAKVDLGRSYGIHSYQIVSLS